MAFKTIIKQYGLQMHTALSAGTGFYKKLLWLVITLIAATSIYVGYRLCVYCRNRVVQKDLYALLEQYQQSQQDASQSKQVDWLVIDKELEKSYAKHSHAPMASWLLVLQAHERVERNEMQQAQIAMDEAVKSLSGSSVDSFIKVSDALLRMDSEDEILRAQGVEMLTALARDTKNIYADMALYHLGRYYWIFDHMQDAKDVWLDLLERYGNVSGTPSPWVAPAQELLEQLG